MFCDNTSAVAWAYKGITSTSISAAGLLRFIALWHRIRKASSLLMLHIAGENNERDDIPLQAFKNGEFFHVHAKLVNYFNTNFPLPHNLSWGYFKEPKKLTSHVISCLCGEQLQMESLLELPSLGKSTGDIGQNTADPSKSTPTWKTSLPANEQSSSQIFPPGYGPGFTVLEIKSALKQSQKRSRPSPRPVNWLENKFPSSKQRANTFYPSNTWLKV